MTAQRDSADSTITALLDLIGAHRITAIIYVAVRLGVVDALLDGPQPAQRLAERSESDERSLRRLLRALVALGVCEQQGDRFVLTALGRPLAGNAEPSLKPWALFEGELLYRSWAGLLDSIRSGKTAAELARVDDTFELMARNPAHVQTFNAAMVAFTHLIAPDVLDAYDFSGIRKLMDVGGGYGELLCAILRAYPSLHGAVFDLPRCAENATRQFSDAGLSGRAEFISGSFFDSVPTGADAILMKSIIHDWNDARSIAILTNCRRALPGGGRLLLVERLMPEQVEVTVQDRFVTLSDVNMLRGPGGCERTEREYRELLQAGGFAMASIRPAGRMAVIEARVG